MTEIEALNKIVEILIVIARNLSCILMVLLFIAVLKLSNT